MDSVRQKDQLKPPSVANSQDLGGRVSARFWTGTLSILALLIAFQAAIFCHSFQKYIAPFYPINNDQLFNFSWAYSAHYHLLSSDLGWLSRDPNIVSNAGFMKGWLVQSLALLFTFIFGPNRLAVGLVNFAFFAIAEVVIFCTMLARRGIVTALLALGFFLLCGTHYYHSGGMFDVRLDYGGMTLMGITFIAALSWLESGSKATLAASLLALVLAVGTRSILLVYWIGALGICFVSSVALLLLRRADKGLFSPLTKRSAVLLGASMAIFAVYVGMFWTQFRNYYVNCKADGEDLMRLRENDVKTIADRFLYYPRSFMDHFLIPLCFAMAGAVSAWGAKLAFAGDGAQPENDRSTVGSNQLAESRVPLLMLFSGIVLTVYVCATYYVPTPVVIGVLAVPISVTAAVLIGSIKLPPRAFKGVAIAASVLVACGVGRYIKEFTRPTYIAQPNRPLTDATNSTMAALSDCLIKGGDRKKSIFWCLVHDGINQEYLKIYFAEHFGKLCPESVVHYMVPAYPQSTLADMEEKIRNSDLVVIPIKLPELSAGQFEYDGAGSVRQHLPELLPILNQDFRPVLKTYFFQTPSSMPGALTVFERFR